MIRATTKKDVTIELSLVMDSESARELMNMVQNPVQKDETKAASAVRMEIFYAIEKALK